VIVVIVEFVRLVIPKRVVVSWRKYGLDLLKKIGMLDCKTTKTPIEIAKQPRLPIETNHPLNNSDGNNVEKERGQ